MACSALPKYFVNVVLDSTTRMSAPEIEAQDTRGYVGFEVRWRCRVFLMPSANEVHVFDKSCMEVVTFEPFVATIAFVSLLV